jgi:cyanophycin synthetase
MHFQKVQALRGPNIWANFPVLEAWVDLGEYGDCSSDELPGFNDRLMAWLPTMIEHRCSVGERGGFFQRLRRGTYPAHILEHITLELQTLAGHPVGYGKARDTSEEGVYRLAVEYEEEDLARACLETARELLLAAIHDRPFDIEGEVARLREFCRQVSPDATTAALLCAARRRKIPVLRLGEKEPLIQLGQGSRQCRLLGTQTDRTGALAASIAQDNELTRGLLIAAGVPVPQGRPVSEAEDAWVATEEVGLPAIVKQRYGHRRRGSNTPLTSREEVLAAYQAAAEETSSLMVERYVAGPQWRLLVVGDEVVSAVHRGQAGPEEVSDRLHPEVAGRAIDAVRAVGLDVAGVDIVAGDIGRPLEDQGGVVVAVIDRPGLALHLNSVTGAPQKGCGGHPTRCAEAIMDHLFPEGETGRIPVAAVTGVNGKTTTTRLMAHILGRIHRCVGMTCTEGIFIDGRRIESGDCSGPLSARTVLRNPAVDAAVFETARGGILRAGLGYDRCDVAVVTNIDDGDHLGMSGIDTPEQLAQVKRVIVEAVHEGGVAVLKANDPLVAGMAEHCRGGVVFFALDGEDPVLVAHRASNGRAAFVRDNHVILAEGEQEIPLVPLEQVPLTHGGRIGFQVENVLAAAAAVWNLGVPCEQIRVGLETFGFELDSLPGRFNLFDVRDATVVLDYGHNPSSLERLLEVLEQLPHQRRLAVYSTAGDRRDIDLVRQGELLGGAFDSVYLFEDHYLRGRQPGEIIGLFRQGLERRGRARQVHEIQGAVAAMEAALQAVRPGELLLIQADVVDESVDFMHAYLARGQCREITFDEAVQLAQRIPILAAAGSDVVGGW